MSSYEEWRAADDRWMERNRNLIALVFRRLMEDGVWPEVDRLQRFLHQSSIRTIDLREAVNGKPPIPGQVPPAMATNITVGSRHLLALPAARTMLNLTVAAARQAVRAYLSTECEDPRVESTQPEIRALADSLTIARFPEFVRSDFPHPFGGSAVGDGWSFQVDASRVMTFEGVQTAEEYVDRQLAFIHGIADEHDRIRGVPTTQTSAQAFIVMPFTKAWSDEVHSFIHRAVARLDGALTAVRADEISQFGRITDQIVDALRNSALIIADITEMNPNVTWELGYAYAHGTPCAILTRKGARDVPFDIYDHRRYEYSEHPSEADEIHLAELIKGSLGL